MTMTWGERDVTESSKTKVDGSVQFLDYDPYRTDFANEPDTEWHFIGNGSSPCPFIVSVDWGHYFRPFFAGEFCQTRKSGVYGVLTPFSVPG